MTVNAITVDLEDWYHVCGDGAQADPAGWDAYESRVTASTGRILDILDKAGAKATFFVLGYIADRNPRLIERIHREGHELAVHGYYHRRVFEMTPAEFEADLERSIRAVESVTGEPVLGFRAPEWSVTSGTYWAFEIMAAAGLSYDSSTVPLTRMGERGLPHLPHRVRTPSGEIIEFPLTTMKCFWERLPFTGGLPMRLFPYWLIAEALRSTNAAGQPGLVYIHPWEFDREQPRIELPLTRRFMHYFNTASTRPKLEGLLRHFRFAPIREVLGL
ncbi:MAG TPA: DUF3473 domain-containing protein [Deltaproteobacteria bacterium]|nr:DUF3473 domain-containing protein [Deltaproteobacteria bacterium]